MNKRWQNCLLILSLFLLALPLAASSQQKEKFFMVMKLEEEPDAIIIADPSALSFKVTNITTNMNDYQGNKLDYDLEKTILWISNYTMHLSQPFQIIDTSTPNILKTRNSDMGIELVEIKENFEKQVNTLTNVTSYKASSPLVIDGQTVIDNLNVTAVTYPNRTGILELREN